MSTETKLSTLHSLDLWARTLDAAARKIDRAIAGAHIGDVDSVIALTRKTLLLERVTRRLFCVEHKVERARAKAVVHAPAFAGCDRDFTGEVEVAR